MLEVPRLIVKVQQKFRFIIFLVHFNYKRIQNFDSKFSFVSVKSILELFSS
jgi:hypothetical protein